MRKEIADRWVKALRSGEYKQGHEALQTRIGFCCLGVLCDLYGKEKGIAWEKTVGTWTFQGYDTLLPQEVQEWAGMESDDGVLSKDTTNTLANINDSGIDFLEIADTIETHYETL